MIDLDNDLSYFMLVQAAYYGKKKIAHTRSNVLLDFHKLVFEDPRRG